MRLRGPVRYRFRAKDDDLEVLVEGDAPWVERVRESLGLEDERVGWSMPLSVTMTTPGLLSSAVAASYSTGGGRGVTGPPRKLPGPTPNPSLIPAVIRSIGSFDMAESLAEYNLPAFERPDSAALERMLAAEEVPEPLEHSATKEPEIEAWVQLLLRGVVREHGVTAISADTILDLLCARAGLDRKELSEHLELLWSLGRLERIHAADSYAYAPTPAWLEAV